MLSSLLFLLLCSTVVESAIVKSSLPIKYFNKNIRKLRQEKDEATADRTIVCSNEMPPEKTLSAFDLCLCGAFATVIGDFAMHPIDTIKIIQQSAGTCFSCF